MSHYDTSKTAINACAHEFGDGIDTEEQSLLDFLSPGTFASILPDLVAGKRVRRDEHWVLGYTLWCDDGSLTMFNGNMDIVERYVSLSLGDLTATDWKVVEGE